MVRIATTMMHNMRSRLRKQISESASEAAKPAKPRKPTRQKTEIQYSNEADVDTMSGSGGSVAWSPPYWRNQLENIRSMRSGADAPVDTMGAEASADASAPPKVQRFHTLVGLMLSSQTKDETTSKAMGRLREYGCTVDSISAIPDETLGDLITPVSFWKKKVQYLKKTAEMLKNDYEGDIPKTVDELCKLPGVGPKMAHLTMQIAWGESTGIGVDTHVHRIANRLGWVQSKTTLPEQTRKELEAWLPKQLWIESNKALVGFGQQICTPLKPHCGECLNQNICPYAIQNYQNG